MSRESKKIYIVRHGERVDFSFGKSWIDKCCQADGIYKRFDMNLPLTLPIRHNSYKSFSNDGPLTRFGSFQTLIIGESLKEAGIKLSHIYSSPALRCIQTAVNILKGLSLNLSIKREYGLFEWLAWHEKAGIPDFMNKKELDQNGYNVDEGFTDFWNISDFNIKETLSDYYERCHRVVESIIERHKNEDGNILLVGHKGSLEVCTRKLTNRPKLTCEAFKKITSEIPYGALTCIERVGNIWQLASTNTLPFTCKTSSKPFNYNVLKTH